MPFHAQVYGVMIASPSDVSEERNIVRSVLDDWNAIHSRTRSMVLLPVGWETHSSPEMGARPQEIINKKVLQDCDLLIGIFWTRIGTSTGEHPSGTVEEIEEHLAQGKPAMLYFSETPVVPSSIDQEQYSKLREFRESCLARGLVETFKNETEFKEKFSKQLQIKLNEDSYFPQDSEREIGDLFSNFGELGSNPANLSEEAKELLLEASQSARGIITQLKFIGGIRIETNGKDFITDSNPRTRVTWTNALEELVDEALIKDKGYKEEIFEVTKKGYDLADTLRTVDQS